MNGYIVHNNDGISKGTFTSFREANRFRYYEMKRTGEYLTVSKESKYRQKYLRDTGLETKVMERTLMFVNRKFANV